MVLHCEGGRQAPQQEGPEDGREEAEEEPQDLDERYKPQQVLYAVVGVGGSSTQGQTPVPSGVG